MPPNDSLVPRIVETHNQVLENKHLTYKQNVECLYDVWNPETPSGRPTQEGLRATTAGLQGLIGRAIKDGKRLRALGGNWSFSRVAASDSRIINTKPLNWVFRFGAASTNLAADYQGDPDQLLLAQCGIFIKELNLYLARYGRSLPTSGASNGQTLAGALSTGTHGSRFDFGGIQDFVIGLHLIVGPDRHVWLERASYPVISDVFADKLGAELIRDDTLFNAALVSFGSFGIIHAAMIETEPLYLLEVHQARKPLNDAFKQALTTLDFSVLPLPHRPERPYHFEVVANPYDLPGGVYLRTMYRRPYRDDYPRPQRDEGGLGLGDDLAGFLGTITDLAPGAVPALMNSLVGRLYGDRSGELGTLGDVFYNTSTRGKAIGSAIGIPLDQAAKALDVAFSVHKTHGPFPVIVALRFVRKSKALMAFTRYETTCVVDFDGVASAHAFEYYDRVWQAFTDAGIPFTMHWGKINTYLNPARIRAVYGDDVDWWLAARASLLDAASRKTFTNAFLERCGLGG